MAHSSIFTAEDEAFRIEVREFIEANLPAEVAARTLRGTHPIREDVVFWTEQLAKRGWATPSWPVEYGGPGWSTWRRHIFEDEALAMGAPEVSPPGNALVGPIIMEFGSHEQKERFLPAIREAREFWTQGFSEPGSGSDLASLRTRADRVGDHYVVNGHKIWTSEANISDWIIVLARTDQTAKPQAGISFFLVDLRTPGITVRPIISIDEGHSLNEVFFDNVQVPLENRVGEENKGWTYAKFLLSRERTVTAAIPRCKRQLARLKTIATNKEVRGGRLIDQPGFVLRVAQLEIELLAHEAAMWRVAAEEEAGIISAMPVASVLKVKGSELLQRIDTLTVEALCDDAVRVYPERDFRSGLPDDLSTPEAPGVVSGLMYRRAMTIYGGSNEIQRDIIAATLLKG